MKKRETDLYGFAVRYGMESANKKPEFVEYKRREL